MFAISSELAKSEMLLDDSAASSKKYPVFLVGFTLNHIPPEPPLIVIAETPSVVSPLMYGIPPVGV